MKPTVRHIAILGSTGSIGQSALDVVARHPDRFAVVGLSCGRNLEKLVEQIAQFRPQVVVVEQAADIQNLRDKLAARSLSPTWHGEILSGPAGLDQLVKHTAVERVLSAIVGTAGLRPTY